MRLAAQQTSVASCPVCEGVLRAGHVQPSLGPPGSKGVKPVKVVSPLSVVALGVSVARWLADQHETPKEAPGWPQVMLLPAPHGSPHRSGQSLFLRPGFCRWRSAMRRVRSDREAALRPPLMGSREDGSSLFSIG